MKSEQFDPAVTGAASSTCSNQDVLVSSQSSSLSNIQEIAAVSDALRLPDYFSVEVAGGDFGVVGGVVATFTRYGTIYVGPEVGAGVPGIAGTLEAGWIDQSRTPSKEALNGFVSGNSFTFGGYVPAPFVEIAGPAAAEVYGNVGQWGWSAFSTQIGIGIGAGKNLALTWSYSFEVSHSGPRW